MLEELYVNQTGVEERERTGTTTTTKKKDWKSFNGERGLYRSSLRFDKQNGAGGTVADDLLPRRLPFQFH